jgi:AcrR family transcriptional regulator
MLWFLQSRKAKRVCGGAGDFVMVGDRKTEILRAALQLVADEGYGSLSVRALARANTTF